MADDDQAIRLVELEIKRNTTLSELDTVRQARHSAYRSMEATTPRQEDIIRHYAAALERDDLPEERRDQLYDEWKKFLKGTSLEFQELVEEWEQLRLREKILSRMIRELDRQIEDTRSALSETP